MSKMAPEWLTALLSEEEKIIIKGCFDLFADETANRNALIQMAREMEDFEKRFASSSPDQLVDSELVGRVLVCTVGLRPMPVVLTTLLVRPVQLYLLHTTESRNVAETIRDDAYVQKLGLDPVSDIQLQTISLTDAPQNYESLRSIVRDNSRKKIVVDISGGVKVMGTSLAAAAFWLRIPVIYQLGEEVGGIVRPFSERLIQLENPFAFFGATDLRSIESLFRYGDYDAALSLAKNLEDGIGDVTTLGRLSVLQDLIRVYRDWDAFRHSILADEPERKLAGSLRAIQTKCVRMHLEFADSATIASNIKFLEEMERSWKKDQRNLTDRYRLVDIYASSRRRAAAGKYDDAVGRLYRCLEMAATLCLQDEYEIGQTKNPDFSTLVERIGGTEPLKEKFENAARYPMPEGRGLGLKDQMILLSLDKSNRYYRIASIYLKMEDEGLLEKRNRSILAHGTVPVSQEEYGALDSKTYGILDFAIGKKGEFEKLLKMAEHPTIQVEL